MNRLAGAVVDRLLDALCAIEVALAVLERRARTDHAFSGDAVHLLGHDQDEVATSSRADVHAARARRGLPATLALSVCASGGSEPFAAVEPADHGGVAVVKEEGSSGVHRGDPRHVLVGEREVEHFEILFHAFTTH